jgi:SAM-dependent methyltransferase
MASLVDRLTNPEQFDLRPTGPGEVLDLGCGSNKWPGSVGVDISSNTAADIVHDPNVYPYPLEDSCFDQVLLQDVVEHIDEPIRLMEEVHRVCRPRARVQLRTPHFSSVLAYGDPTHRHYFSRIAVESLAAPRFEHYTPVRFRITRTLSTCGFRSAFWASAGWLTDFPNRTSRTLPFASPR